MIPQAYITEWSNSRQHEPKSHLPQPLLWCKAKRFSNHPFIFTAAMIGSKLTGEPDTEKIFTGQ